MKKNEIVNVKNTYYNTINPLYTSLCWVWSCRLSLRKEYIFAKDEKNDQTKRKTIEQKLAQSNCCIKLLFEKLPKINEFLKSERGNRPMNNKMAKFGSTKI